MAITLRNPGTWAAVTANAAVTLPTHQTDDMLIVRVAMKSGAASTEDTSISTAGWTKIGQGNNGTTNASNGGGSVIVSAFYKVAESSSETNPTVAFDNVNIAAVVAMAYQKGSTEMWQTPMGNSGPDTTSGTSHSATIATHIRTYSGDVVDFFTGIADDTTMTVPTFTQAGATLDTVTESPATALSSTSGFDISADGGYRTLTSGTSTAAAVVTGTLSTAETGTSWTTRLRVSAPPVAQAQARIKGIGVNNYGQANSHIKVTTRVYSQAAALISGTYTIPFTDPFTRTEVDTLGNAPNGDTWVQIMGTASADDVNGSAAVFTVSGLVSEALHRTSTSGGIEISFDFASSGLPNNLAYVELTSNASGGIPNNQGGTLQLWASLDEFGNLVSQAGDINFLTTNSSITYTPNDVYTFKAHLTPTGTEVVSKQKFWKVGSTEPG